MRKESPVDTQLPEWKKEIAEKVKAYEERKKRLTTPPHPLKNSALQNQEEIPVKQPSPPVVPVDEAPVSRSSVIPQREHIKRVVQAQITPAESNLEVWTEDVESVLPVNPLAIKPDHQQQGIVKEDFDEEGAVPRPQLYLLRRAVALAVDHVMLITVAAVLLFVFAFFLNQSLQSLVLSRWKGSLGLFLTLHCAYHLYFWRGSRQTPGMLFVSLELRDPVLSTIGFGKLVVRWLLLVVLGPLNLVPVIIGKDFVIMDQITNTRIRSFQ